MSKGNLVLTRRKSESIEIDFGGEVVELTVLEINGNQCRLLFNADRSVTIHRSEIAERIRDEKIR